jgi:hypothetical protein
MSHRKTEQLVQEEEFQVQNLLVCEMRVRSRRDAHGAFVDERHTATSVMQRAA